MQKCKKTKRPYEKLLENPEAEGPRELFLPENNFKTCNTVSFLKKHPDFGDLDMKFRLSIFFSHALTHIWTQYNRENQQKKAKNLHFTIF